MRPWENVKYILYLQGEEPARRAPGVVENSHLPHCHVKDVSRLLMLL